MVTATDKFMATLGLPEVYRVGGSVRDELLGRNAKDSDYIVRGASISEIKQKLAEALVIAKPLLLRDGRQIGVRALTQRFGALEIVLPRSENSTGPGHRDFAIAIDPHLSLKLDALRRDFTINALYKNVLTGDIIDPLGEGEEDLERGVIRTVHQDSFRDDPLRTLRALRFMSTLPAFCLSPATYAQMWEHASRVNALTLKGVSGTALSELLRLLDGATPVPALYVARDTGVLQVLLPELASIIGFKQNNAHHTKDLDAHTFDAVQAAATRGASTRVRLALLFHDAGKPWMAWGGKDGYAHYYALTPQQIAEQPYAPPTAVYSHEWWGAWLANDALTRLNAPAALRQDVVTLIERHMLPLVKTRAIKVREWRAELGDSLLRDLIAHRRYDVISKGTDATEAIMALDGIAEQHARDIHDRVPRTVKDLAATGGAIAAATGLKGAAIGDVQRQLLHETMAQPKLNTHDWVIARAQSLARKAS